MQLKFILQAKGDTTQRRVVYPIYGDDCSFKWEKDAGEQYFRKKWSGELTFVRGDYTFIVGADIETEFFLTIEQDGTEAYKGRFSKTDCAIDYDNENVVVTPEVYDAYSVILSGIDKEYDLYKILPDIQPIQLDKRSMVQIYALGEEKVSCFLSGMTWEEDCEVVDSENDLLTKYHFGKMYARRIVDFNGSMTPKLPNAIWGTIPASTTNWSVTMSGYTLKLVTQAGTGGGGTRVYTIVRTSDNKELWQFTQNAQAEELHEFTMTPISGSGATGNVEVYFRDVTFFGRYLCDKEKVTIGATILTTGALSSEDMVSNNRNFHRALAYVSTNTILIYDGIGRTITNWYYDDGKYYQKPPHGGSTGIPDYYPIAQTYWTNVSFWYRFDLNDNVIEPNFRKEYTLKDSYSLASVLDRLLNKITEDAGDMDYDGMINFYDEEWYSRFFYGINPITNTDYRIFLTPKSNILAGEYEQPAQTAPITLRKVLDMIRDVFRCYWWIERNEDEGEWGLRIEHISYFLGGGKYFATPSIGIDLTTLINPRNGLSWGFGVNSVKYDKTALPERYEFAWADESTEYFKGEPIDIVSKYTDKGEVESITINDFSSDVDYMLLNPSVFNKDGFALLCAEEVSIGVWKIPYLQVNDNVTLQNGFLSFYNSQQFYLYDMPAWSIKVNGASRQSIGVKRTMTQEVSVPSREFDLQKLVRTSVGDGQIESVSQNTESEMLEIELVFEPK